jgi:uncharacterized membrane-anchored protein YhcB (DUF1043 family)
MVKRTTDRTREELFKHSNESVRALDKAARKGQRLQRRAAWWSVNRPQNETPSS